MTDTLVLPALSDTIPKQDDDEVHVVCGMWATAAQLEYVRTVPMIAICGKDVTFDEVCTDYDVPMCKECEKEWPKHLSACEYNLCRLREASS